VIFLGGQNFFLAMLWEKKREYSVTDSLLFCHKSFAKKKKFHTEKIGQNRLKFLPNNMNERVL
jgi:hypothetical protein